MANKGWLKELTREHGAFLIKLARNTISEELGLSFKHELNPKMFDDALLSQKAGVFVTLYKKGELRGCIGNILPENSIIEGVKENAINAAFNDPRFPPLSKNEFKDIKVEISILSPPKPLKYEKPEELLKKLTPHKDGVIIQKGWSRATFLPQVWEKLPDPEEFLTHLCFKAGLPGNIWREEPLEVHTYQVIAFEEE